MRSNESEETRRMTPPQLAAVTAAGVCAVGLVVKLLLARHTGLISVWAAGWHVLAGLLYALLMLGILYTGDDDEAAERASLSDAEREYLQYQSGLKVNIKRYEAMLALGGSAVLLAVAYYVFMRVLDAQATVPAAVVGPLLVLAVVYFAMQFLAQFTFRIGTEHEAPGLVATSFHARTDSFATLLAMLAVIVAAMGFGFERLIAAIIGLLLVADAAQLFVDATRRLVGLEEDGPTAQLPFWVRLRDALRAYAEQMPPLVRWLLRYEDAMTAEELRRTRRTAITLAAALYLLSGFHSVRVGEVGAVKFMGRYWGIAQPGPVYALWPFASVRISPVDRVQRVTLGYDWRPDYKWSSYQEERPFGVMAWGDANANEVFNIDNEASMFMLGDTTAVENHLSLTYSVRHDRVKRYLFLIEAPEQLVQRALQEACQTLMGVRTLDEVLVENRASLEHDIARLVQLSVDPYDVGIVIESVMLRNLHPPVEVVDAFRDVASAIEEMARETNQAEAYQERVLETARGEAERTLNVAEAEKVRRVSDAEGQTAEFRQVYAAAAADGEALKARLAIEVMERLLTNRKLVVLPRSRGSRPQIWFGSGGGGGNQIPMISQMGEPGSPGPQPEPEEGGEAPAPAAAEAAGEG